MNTSTRLLLVLGLQGLLLSHAPAVRAAEAPPEGLSSSDWGSIRAAYEAGRHEFFKQEDGTHTARNPGLGWRMTFDDKGFTAEPEDGSWSWGLELEETGSDEASRSDRPYATYSKTRLSLPRTPLVTEWFVNDQRGLEQGWTLSAPAEIRLRVRGGLKPEVSAQSVVFGGQITYSGLKAWDATGKIIPTHFEATAEGFAVRYDDSGARYPLTIDPIAQNAYLKASNTGANDQFGISLAISGDTVVVGAIGEDSNATGVNGNQADNTAGTSGAAYVFTRSGSTWSQQAYLKASNTGAGDSFGYSVTISGDTVVVGAPGEDSNATGVNGNQADNSAASSGAAYVFTRRGSTWSQQAYLKASNTGASDQFGWSVAISGDSVVVGAYGEDSNATGVNDNEADNSAGTSGAAYVFTRSGSTWRQQAYLKASNTEAIDVFGYSVAISGDTVVVGANGEDSNTTGVNGNQADNTAGNSGAAYVFTRSGSTWSQQAYLKASNTGASDQFGWSVAISGDSVVVGAYGEASNATGVNGNQADNTAGNSGAAYVFTRSGSTWSQQAYLKASNTGANDQFSYSVAISGDTVVVGAYGEASNATGVNGNQADNSASIAGAAYLFNLGEVLTSLAKSGTSAPGAANIAFGRLGQGSLNPAGETLFSSTLLGSGASGGRNSAVFSTINGTTVDLALQKATLMSGVASLPANAKIVSLTNPIARRDAGGTALFEATVSGTGINGTNNRLILSDNGAFISPIVRTGLPVAALGGAVPRTFSEVLQAEAGIDRVFLRYALKAGTAGVTVANDSGVMELTNEGTLLGTTAREGSPAFGGGGTFGQVHRHSLAGFYSNFIAKFIPTSGTPVDAYFFTGALDGRVAGFTQNANPPGALSASEKFRTFTGNTASSSLGILRATVSGSAAAKNEGVWEELGPTLLLRKGDTDLGGGLRASRILRVWGSALHRMLAQVTLAGPGVTSKNNQALVLQQFNGAFLILLRSGQTAPGIGSNKVTIGKFQAVDVDLLSGSYVVLTSLAGAASSANQALFSGSTLAGNDTTLQHLRLPKLRLQKGEFYRTEATPQDTIKSLAIRPILDRSGVGGRGQGQIINPSGEMLVEITGDRGVKELVKLTP